MKVGDKVTRQMQWMEQVGRRGMEERNSAKGTVVWVHPRRRFYVVEFDFNGKTFRETYYN